VRAQIAAARAEVVNLEQEFSRNIVGGRARIPFRITDLEGVPADYLRSHQPDANGNILVSNDQEDLLPIILYCKNPESRLRAWIFLTNRGYPANMETLSKLIAGRYKLAFAYPVVSACRS
jgi:thimet oligopeptidase